MHKPLLAILLVIVLSLLTAYAPHASAATKCPSNPYRCSQAEARTDSESQAKASGAKFCVAPHYKSYKQEVHIYFHNSTSVGYYGSRFMCQRTDGSYTNSWSAQEIEFSHYYNDCLNRAAVEEANQPTGSLRCVAGCEHRFFQGAAANTGSTFFSRGVATGQACKPEEYQCPAGFRRGGAGPSSLSSGNCIPDQPPDCPEGQSKVDGVCKRTEQCPSGMVQDEKGACVPKKTECPAGQVKGPDGSCVDDGKCPAGQARGKDGSCKKDDDNDGNPDTGEDDGKFSGGDTCEKPPQCSGDNILCGQARIQWRIDCNTRKARNISGGACNAVPLCTGEKCDALEYSQMLFQWRSACALEKLAESAGQPGVPGGVAGGDTCAAPPTCASDAQQCAIVRQQWRTRCEAAQRHTDLSNEAANANASDGALEHAADRLWGEDATANFDPDDSGLGWGRSCPAAPSVFGQQLNFAGLCDAMNLFGLLVLAIAFAHALYIMMGD